MDGHNEAAETNYIKQNGALWAVVKANELMRSFLGKSFSKSAAFVWQNLSSSRTKCKDVSFSKA